MAIMNIQIFGTKKCNDTKKAQRYFKERNIKVQFINLKEKSMSKGELTSVMQAVGGMDKLINPKAKDQDTLALIKYIFIVSGTFAGGIYQFDCYSTSLYRTYHSDKDLHPWIHLAG